MKFNTPSIRQLIRLALEEDSTGSDLTSRLLLHPRWKIEAIIRAKEKGVVAGLPLAGLFFRSVDPSVQFKATVREGASVHSGSRLAILTGRARSILTAERPALNALQHLSGIATFTHAQVQKIKGTKTKLFDTRKTLPGWRTLQKYAVLCGGGSNHRMSLGDALMIKENHLHIARAAHSDWIGRARREKKKRGSPLLQMEVQTERDLKDAVLLRPERVLLDNQPPKTLKRMIRWLREKIPGVEIELTGGVNPKNIRSLARLGADRISMGRLTHTVAAFDCSLDIFHVYTS